MTQPENRFQQACQAFDALNAQDPKKVLVDGESQPHEYVYAQRLTQWVEQLTGTPSEALLLAARCQHLCRWEIPRSDYPMNRPGYLKWREDLKKFHAKKSADILAEVGYDDALIAQVTEINLKKNRKQNFDSQTIEDALCLVFLQYQFTDLIAKTEEPKMIGILQKTWLKMSEAGHQAALGLDYTDEEKAVLDKALSAA